MLSFVIVNCIVNSFFFLTVNRDLSSITDSWFFYPRSLICILSVIFFLLSISCSASIKMTAVTLCLNWCSTAEVLQGACYSGGPSYRPFSSHWDHPLLWLCFCKHGCALAQIIPFQSLCCFKDQRALLCQHVIPHYIVSMVIELCKFSRADMH